MKDLGKGILSTSLLKAAKGSDAAQSTVIDKIDARLRQQCSVYIKRLAGSWLSRLPLTELGKCRYVWMANPDIPLCDLASLNWVSHRVPSSPAFEMKLK